MSFCLYFFLAPSLSDWQVNWQVNNGVVGSRFLLHGDDVFHIRVFALLDFVHGNRDVF